MSPELVELELSNASSDARTSQEIIQENRDYTLFSWSVQSTANPMQLKRAKGVYFWDGEDNRWLDFSSQLINMNVGHQHPKVLEAIKKQVDELCFAGPAFATEPRGSLGRKLAEVTGLAKVFFTLGGSEANENAIKIARLFTGRNKIITRYRSYHGATMGSMSASGDPRRWPIEPGAPGMVRVFDPYCYRCPFGQKVETCHRNASRTSRRSSRWKVRTRSRPSWSRASPDRTACSFRPMTTTPSCARSAIATASCSSTMR